jgi:GT2 family glycosyltransferase
MTGEFSRVMISVINWNGASMTIQCLESLARLDYPHAEPVIVDNASRDDSVERIQAAFPDVPIIRSAENLGFAGGHRLALEQAKQTGVDLFWMLNNDAVAEPGTLGALVDAYRRHGAALYGSVVLMPGAARLIDAAGHWQLGPDGKPRIREPFKPHYEQPYDTVFADRSERRVAALNGSSFMVPVQVARQYGFMDERFFMNAEETDYCFRLGKQGVPSILVPTSVIVHESSGSFKLAPGLDALGTYYQTRNRLFFLWRHGGLWAFLNALRQRLKRTWRMQVISIVQPGRVPSLNQRLYFEALAVRHALLNRRGKTLAPEDFLR